MLMSVDGYVEDEHGTPSQWIVVLFEIRSAFMRTPDEKHLRSRFGLNWRILRHYNEIARQCPKLRQGHPESEHSAEAVPS